MNKVEKLFNRVVGFLDNKQKLRKETGYVNVSMSLFARIFSACVPVLAFLIVIYQVYTAGNTKSILETSGVEIVDDWNWSVKQFPKPVFDRQCFESFCWRSRKPTRSIDNIHLPWQDPVGQKLWEQQANNFISYTAYVSRQQIGDVEQPTLYLPGIRAKQVYVFVNKQLKINSHGGLPFFISLETNEHTQDSEIEVLLETEPTTSFQGFIRQSFFKAPVLSAYRAHYRLTFRAFPRHAVVLFLLAIGALTFSFFIFLDQKRELFALGLAISFLGVSESVRVGIIPFLATKTFFVLFSLHIIYLFWYAIELARLTHKTPVYLGYFGIAALSTYFASFLAPESIGTFIRQGLLQMMNGIPMFLGLAGCLIALALLAIKKERSSQLAVSSVGFIFYSAYLFSYDFGVFKYIAVLGETPVLFCTTMWIISALASLGSLERRVQLAVEDRQKRFQLEQELKFAEEVQQSFIKAGKQPSRNYQVLTFYQAAKSVGGDWVAWRDLKSGIGLGIIGDVVGKGVQAGLIVSACDAILQSLVEDLDPERAGYDKELKKIVHGLYSAVISRHEKRAMTAMIILADQTGHLHLTSLGHPPLIGISTSGVRILTAQNSWISPSFNLDKINMKTFPMLKDEIILGYTDGICDGSREVRHFRKKWEGWHEKSFDDFLEEFKKFTPDYDDQSILLFKFNTNQNPQILPNVS